MNKRPGNNELFLKLLDTAMKWNDKPICSWDQGEMARITGYTKEYGHRHNQSIWSLLCHDLVFSACICILSDPTKWGIRDPLLCPEIVQRNSSIYRNIQVDLLYKITRDTEIQNQVVE